MSIGIIISIALGVVLLGLLAYSFIFSKKIKKDTIDAYKAVGDSETNDEDRQSAIDRAREQIERNKEAIRNAKEITGNSTD